MATSVFYQQHGWDGLVVWISAAYTVVTLSTACMYVHTKVKERKKKARREARRTQVEHAGHIERSEASIFHLRNII